MGVSAETQPGRVRPAVPLHYRVYGLGLRSGGVFPGLAPVPDPVAPDVCVRFGSMPTRLARLRRPGADCLYAGGDLDGRGLPLLRVTRDTAGARHLFRYGDGTEFGVERASSSTFSVCCGSARPLTAEDATTYLLGPVLGFVPRRLGITCLHASAVLVGGRAVALAGPPGAGKSTTAAEFARAGEFRRLAALAPQRRVYRPVPDSDPARLPALCELVRRQVEQPVPRSGAPRLEHRA